MALLTRTSDLEALCARMRGAAYITVDTEFMRERTYWPKLCLVQIADEQGATAIDPLAPGLDLAPLFALMHDASVLKVFHAARQDLEIFLYLSGQLPSPVFDTQVAAMVCGFGDQISYDRLVGALTGEHVDKTSGFTDWSLRPLTERQAAYAMADVTHLRTVYEKLRDKLEETGRAHWVAEEVAVIADPATYRTVPEEAWQRLKLRSGNPRFLAAAQALGAWREREAQKRDVPRGRILKDEAITEIASTRPKDAEQLSRTRALGRGAAEGPMGQAILAVLDTVREVAKADAPSLPDRPELPRGLGPVVDLLKVLLKMKCEEHQVAPRLVASSLDLEMIAADDEAQVQALFGWRREVFGEAALELKQGRLALAVDGKRTLLVPVVDGAAEGASRRRR